MTEREKCETCIHAKPFGGENDNRCGAWSCEYINRKDAIEVYKAYKDILKENGMGMLKLFERKEKESLRDYCLNKYGEEFIEKYDTLCSGGVIGNLSDTASFIMVVDLARAEWRRKHGIEV